MKNVKLWANGHLTITTKTNPPSPDLGAKKEKTFSLDWNAYRKITSGVHILFQQKKHAPQFITLTSRIPIHPKIFVNAQTAFLKNCVKTYGLSHYVWVLEYHKSGDPHTHVVADMAKFNIQDVQAAWNSALYTTCKNWIGDQFTGENSPYEMILSEKSTFRLPRDSKQNQLKKYGKGNTLEDAQGMGKYMAKYAAKAVQDQITYPCRCYGVSRNIDTTPISLNYADFCAAIRDRDIDLQAAKWKFLSENIEIFDVFAQKDLFLQNIGVI